jgi:hypothetical protein
VKRKILITLVAAFSLSGVGLAVGATDSPSAWAGSSSCGEAVCMFQHSNYDGLVLRGAYGVCGLYPNLTQQKFNDMISSIKVWVNHSQLFWSDTNYKGSKLTLGAYSSKPTIETSWNDRISSLQWIG